MGDILHVPLPRWLDRQQFQRRLRKWHSLELARTNGYNCYWYWCHCCCLARRCAKHLTEHALCSAQETNRVRSRRTWVRDALLQQFAHPHPALAVHSSRAMCFQPDAMCSDLRESHLDSCSGRYCNFLSWRENVLAGGAGCRRKGIFITIPCCRVRGYTVAELRGRAALRYEAWRWTSARATRC